MATPKKKKSVKKPMKKSAVKAKKSPAKKIKVVASPKKTKAPAAAVRIDWQKNIQPLQDRVVAIELVVSNTTASGLILPEETGSFKKARVVAAGSGRVNKKGKIRPLDVQIGDVVLLSAHSGTKVTVENQEAIIVREDEVLGIVSTPSL